MSRRIPIRSWALIGFLLCLLFESSAIASVNIPAGGRIALNGGGLGVGCTDMTVGGNLQLGSGAVFSIRDMRILAGSIDAGSGTLTLGGNWDNQGSFIAGSSLVSIVDACAPAAGFSGPSTFYDLSLVSSIGKRITILPGQTQTVLHALTIIGTLANPIQIQSGVPGRPGFLQLDAFATQNISHVGVSDNWATGQPLAPTLSNEGGTGNSLGWFGVALDGVRPVPAIGNWGLALLTIMMIGFGWIFRAGFPHTSSRKIV